MSTSSEGEEQSLLNSTLAVSYSKSADDPFSVKMNQEKARRTRGVRISIGEHTPAYSVLKEHSLLVTAFRKETFDDIFTGDDLSPNSSLAQNFAKRWKWGESVFRLYSECYGRSETFSYFLPISNT